MRLLIAGGEVASSPDELPPGVRVLIDAAAEILAIAPSLPGRLEWLASATDKAREQADERLGAVLGHLHELGAEARGAVGSDDPIVAFEDAARDFHPDHIVVALRRGDRAGWQERGLIYQLVERFSIPVTAFEL